MMMMLRDDLVLELFDDPRTPPGLDRRYRCGDRDGEERQD